MSRCLVLWMTLWSEAKQQNTEGERLKGLVRRVTSSNIKENTDSWSIIFSLFAYRITLYVLEFSIEYVKLISSFYCNCDTVMAKTTVIPLTFVVQPWTFQLRLKTRRAKCCFVVLIWLLFTWKSWSKICFFEAKGKKFTVNIFINTGCSAVKLDFYTLVFPFRSWS